MNLTNSFAAAGRDGDLIDEMRSAAVGRRIRGVQYVVPTHDQRPDPLGLDRLVHEVSMGVSLHVDGSALHFTWATDSLAEWLAVVCGEVPSEFFGLPMPRFDVTGVPPWPDLIGRTVVDVSASWHRPDEAGPELIWAVKIDVAGADPVVVTLGTTDDGPPRYMPDSLLVIFDKEVASSYIIPASDGSFW